jgi:hypothetical protein
MVVAPVQRCDQRLMPRICGSPTELQEIEARTQPCHCIPNAEDGGPSGGELDGEGNAVKLPANLGNHGSFVVTKRKVAAASTDTLGEQPYGRIGNRLRRCQPRLLRRAIQWTKTKYVFARDVQCLPASRKNADVGGILKNIAGDLSSFPDQMLATIDNDKHPARAQKIKQRLPWIDRLRPEPDRGSDRADQMFLVVYG